MVRLFNNVSMAARFALFIPLAGLFVLTAMVLDWLAPTREVTK